MFQIFGILPGLEQSFSLASLSAGVKILAMDQTPGPEISGGLSHPQVMLLEALGHIFSATDVVSADSLALEDVNCKHKDEIGGAGVIVGRTFSVSFSLSA